MPNPPGDLEIWPGSPADWREDREVVLLLHGLSGKKEEWTNPAWREFNYMHWARPRSKIYSNRNYPPIDHLPEFSLSDMINVESWKDFLQRLGHTVIAYSQDGPDQRLEVPLRQFREDIVPYIRQEILTGRLAGKKVTVLAHSRGGLLIRKYLHDVDPSESGTWIKTVITLHSPHTGSSLASIDDLAWITGPILGCALFGNIFMGIVLGAATGFIASCLIGEGGQELEPSNPLFQELDASTSPNNDITFHTFGGTSVTIVRIYSWNWTAASYLPRGEWYEPWNWHWDWELAPSEIPLISPLLDAIPNPPQLDEVAEGKGDILVANKRSKLDFAPHQSNPINHAEALWDTNLFAQVSHILGTPVSPRPHAGPRYYGNLRSKELHDLDNLQKNCQINEIQRGAYFTSEQASEAMNWGWDGCYYCIRRYHTQ